MRRVRCRCAFARRRGAHRRLDAHASRRSAGGVFAVSGSDHMRPQPRRRRSGVALCGRSQVHGAFRPLCPAAHSRAARAPADEAEARGRHMRRRIVLRRSGARLFRRLRPALGAAFSTLPSVAGGSRKKSRTSPACPIARRHRSTPLDGQDQRGVQRDRNIVKGPERRRHGTAGEFPGLSGARNLPDDRPDRNARRPAALDHRRGVQARPSDTGPADRRSEKRQWLGSGSPTIACGRASG